MKTKQQEIDQLKRFLDRLEPGGYLDQIFSGVLGYVERDIRNDMAYNLVTIIRRLDDNWSECKVELTRVDTEREKMRVENVALKTQIAELKAKVEELKDADENHENACRYVETLEDQLEQCRVKVEEAERLRVKNAEQEEEILKLKAKLYDAIKKED